ncbi:MAG: NIPSNAP family protein [Cyclobacteriaceae bacterium]
MKIRSFLVTTIAFLIIQTGFAQGNQEYYQLRTFTFESAEQQNVTEQYLQDAYLPALKRQGYGPVGVFKTRLSESDTTRKIWVLIPLKELSQVLSIEEQLEKDEVYLKAGTGYIDASYDAPTFTRIESTLLKAFIDMPKMSTPELSGPREDRVYELRSYESSSEKIYKNKVDMFNAGGEVKLFDQLQFNAVFYGEVISGSQMPNLMYMTTFDNQQSRDEHWQAFRTSPIWEELKSRPEYQNNVSSADIWFLTPTAYSDY